MSSDAVTDATVGRKESYFRWFWEHRWLTVSLANAELQQTVIRYPLSYLWWLLEPVLMLGCYVFLVTALGRGGARGGVPYYVFLFLGVMPWYWTTRCVSGALNLMGAYAGPITQIKFPKLTLIAARFFHETVLFLIGNSITLVLLFSNGKWPGVSWLFWLLLVALHSLLILALMLFFSALSVSLPDLAKMMPFVLRLWFYATPILYEVNMAKAHLSTKMMLTITFNPMAYLTISYRDIFLLHRPPDMHEYFIWLLVCIVLLISGVFFFIRRERNFARYL